MKKAKILLLISLIAISSIYIFIDRKKKYLSLDNILGVYINDELSDKMPSKGDALFQKAVCDDNANASWDSDKWGLLISNLNKKVKCNLYFYSGPTEFDFDYTGDIQTFVAPFSGTYRLETWGAQGSHAFEGIGGYGGNATGNVFLEKDKIIYISTGYYESNYGNSGGGATYITSVNKPLPSLNNDISSILIVSGGGGNGEREHGGSGGGYIGGKGYSIVGSYNNFASGGTQNSGGHGIEADGNVASANINGTFGLGGDGNSSTDPGPNGGDGFYGGGAVTLAGGAGGGSGYIGNPLLKDKVMYCYNCEESNEESTKTISTTCNEETPTSNCAKKGNGYARITLISIEN